MTPEETLRALREHGCRVSLSPAPEAGHPIIVVEELNHAPAFLKVAYQENQAAITALLVEEGFEQMRRGETNSEDNPPSSDDAKDNP